MGYWADPVLFNENLPLGIVKSISGIECHDLKIDGESAHAGTTTIKYRKIYFMLLTKWF